MADALSGLILVLIYIGFILAKFYFIWNGARRIGWSRAASFVTLILFFLFDFILPAIVIVSSSGML